MAQNIWTGTGIGTWTTAGDWSLGHVPTSSEDALIDVIGSIVGSGANETVNSIGTGSLSVLVINGGSTFVTADGTGPFGNLGSISVDDGSTFQVDAGSVFGSGIIQLNSVGALTSFSVFNVVTLDGGGKIEMSTTGNNQIVGVSALSQIDNQNDDIGGGGLIDNVFFDNQANGTLETSSPLGSGGTLQITGRGGFQNEGHVIADNGGTIALGLALSTQTIFNFGLIEALGASTATKIEIAGNVTINQGPGARIQLGGPSSSFDEILSNGLPVVLDINGGTLDGAGMIGDANLTVKIEQGTLVNSDTAGGILNFRSPSITNAGTLEATNNGRLNFTINSTLANNGTIVVEQGELDLGGTVTGSGTIEFGGGSLIDVNGTANVINDFVFTGGPARLIVGSPNGVEGNIIGASAGLVLDARAVAFGNLHVTWQQNGGTGKLSLIDNGTGNILVSFNLVGQYDQSDFSASSDGVAGTQINIVNPSPPTGTTGDMIVRNFNTGVFEIYDIGNNAILSAHALGQVGTDWSFVTLGSFFGTDTTDMILHNLNTGGFEVYDISNNNITGAALLGTVGGVWLAQGFGNFSSNPGETDMLLRNDTTGQFEVYDISSNKITFAASMGSVGLDWQPVSDSFGDSSIGNFSSLGESDMILRNQTTGAMEVYDISHNQITNAFSMGTVGTDWIMVGVGNFSSNPGETDLMMRNGHTGAFELYDVANNKITNAFSIGAVGLDWFVTGFGPLNGAGTSDMVLRNFKTGAVEVYDIANNQITNAVQMGSIGSDWNTGGIATDPPSAPTASMGANSTAQLVQAMASFGGGSGAALNTAPLGAETSQQQPLLTTPQHA
jgi:hypothetical protein